MRKIVLFLACISISIMATAQIDERLLMDQKMKPKVMKDMKKVVIGRFEVGYSLVASEAEKVKRQSSGGVSTATLKIQASLTNLDDAHLRKLTNEIYEEFLIELKNQGYEVIDNNSMFSSKAFGKLTVTKSDGGTPVIRKTSSKKNNTHGSREAVFYTPAGIAQFGVIKLSETIKLPMAYQKYSAEVDAIVMEAVFMVHFMEFEAGGILNKAIARAKIKGVPQIFLASNNSGQGDTKINFSAKNPKKHIGSYTLMLKKPYASASNFGEMVEVSSQEGDISGFGGGQMSSYKESAFRIDTDPSKYDEIVKKLIADYRATFFTDVKAAINK